MSIAKNASRFDFLPDDAGDPFENASKKNKKKNSASGSGDANKKGAKKNSANSDRKQLQSLAFGSATEGKKKNSVKAASNTQLNGCNNDESCQPSAAKDSISSTSSGGKEKNGNCPPDKHAVERPKGISKEQWEQWQKRDADFADETYATDLQNALLQSKLEFESEQKNKPPVKGKKKKPVAVSLTEFNARLTDASSANPTSYITNGNLLGQSSSFGNHNYQVQPTSETDEELVERFRMEARLEIERERQKAIERQLLMSRQPPPPRPSSVQVTPTSTSGAASSPPDEKDIIISRLTEENLHLKRDIDLLKERVKTINNYLQAAQEVKDKAKLIYELENMTRANSDLNEELRQVHSQLEQEKSRSSAAMLELRRLLENRRRTTTEGSTS